MYVHIAEAKSEHELKAIRYLEGEVFGREMGVELPELPPQPESLSMRLLARAGADGPPVATLTVIETTRDSALHAAAGVELRPSERAARYTRLAVLPAYRGCGMSIRLMLEARERFVVPMGIRQTWLLFNAQRARSSSLVSILGFTCTDEVVHAEHGICRALWRDEWSDGAVDGTRRGWAFVARHQGLRHMVHLASAAGNAA